ncbi:alpha/beta hydrolase [Streptomyces sp. NPDC057445]|uniref:alpha/beta hydrolase n=1 Tax=Streptomyces sp. NPDC057445 TaxID=3346136 RepID=UPI003681A7D3
MSKQLMAVCAAPVVAARAAYTAFHPPRPAGRRRPDQFGLEAEEFTIAVTPGPTRLSAWLCRGDPGRVVLLGHGLGLEKSRSLPYARFLHRHGFTVLLFDFRNHGDSSQDHGFAGYDRRFAQDAVAAATHLRAMPEFAEARLALYGFSLSSFAMMRSLDALHGVVDAVVCDSGPASDPPAIAPNLLRSGLVPVPAAMREAPARAVTEHLFRLFNRITMGSSGDWPPKPDRPVYATTPMLFIAGGADSVVPAEEILRLARVYPRAQTLVVPGAKHLRAMWTDKEQYTSTVLDFLERCLDPTKAVH